MNDNGGHRLAHEVEDWDAVHDGAFEQERAADARGLVSQCAPGDRHRPFVGRDDVGAPTQRGPHVRDGWFSRGNVERGGLDDDAPVEWCHAQAVERVADELDRRDVAGAGPFQPRGDCGTVETTGIEDPALPACHDAHDDGRDPHRRQGGLRLAEQFHVSATDVPVSHQQQGNPHAASFHERAAESVARPAAPYNPWHGEDAAPAPLLIRHDQVPCVRSAATTIASGSRHARTSTTRRSRRRWSPSSGARPRLSRVRTRTRGQRNPKKSIYRIYRDTRFSADKTPLKTHIGVDLRHRDLGKADGAGSYPHIEPKMTMFAGGLYAPMPPQLRALRGYIADNASRFRSIVEAPAFTRTFDWEGEVQTRVPRGYPTDHPAADYLKCRRFVGWAEHPAAFATTDEFYPTLIKAFRLLLPLVRFINEAMLATRRMEIR